MSLSDWITGEACREFATAIPATAGPSYPQKIAKVATIAVATAANLETAKPLSARQQGLIALWLALDLWPDADARDVLAQCRADPAQAAYYLQRAEAFNAERQRAHARIPAPHYEYFDDPTVDEELRP